jgi:predicted ester cyclase
MNDSPRRSLAVALNVALQVGASLFVGNTATADMRHFGNLGQPTEVHCADSVLLDTYYGFFDDIWISRKMDEVDRWVDPSFMGPVEVPGFPKGKALVMMFEEGVSNAFPRRYLFNDLVLCADNIVAAYQTVIALNEGPFLGKPPSGRLTRVTWTDTYRFRDGRVYQTLGSDGDTLGTRMQIGWKLVAPGARAPVKRPVPWVDYYPYAGEGLQGVPGAHAARQ